MKVDGILQLRFFFLLPFIYMLTTFCYATETDRNVTFPYYISHQLQFVPDIGLTLLSKNSTNLYLDNGETEDFTFSFLFVPENGTNINQYDFVFSCQDDRLTMNQSCETNNFELKIGDSNILAYNSTTTCSLAGFPGTSICRVTALPVNQVIEGSAVELLQNRHENVYTSTELKLTVYGIVFYTPDSNGQRTTESTIVSGVGRSFKLENYIRTMGETSSQVIPSYIFIPPGSEPLGQKALTVFSRAAVSVIDDDPILRYNPSGCTFENTVAQGLNLQFPSTCGLAVGIKDDSSPISLIAAFEPYRSGNFTIDIQIPSFGSSGEDYIQVLQLQVLEPAPPVVTNVQIAGDPTIRSVPCGRETIQIFAFNVREATERKLVISNDDGTTTTWTEVTSEYSYSRELLRSNMTFLSAGGSGTNVPFKLIAIFDGESREGIFTSTIQTLTFSEKPTLSRIRPNLARVQGGPGIQLFGNFKWLTTNSFVQIGGFIVKYQDIFVESQSRLTVVAPPRQEVGYGYKYNITVSICAEESNPQMLLYYVPPVMNIIATGVSQDDKGVYLIPEDGSVFVATASQNIEGLVYQWKVTTSSNDEITIGGVDTDVQQFLVDPKSLPSSTDIYNLTVTGTNSLGLSDTQTIEMRPVAASEEYLTVIIYPPETLTRSLNAPVLIQASISAVTSNSTSPIILVWKYDGTEYVVDESNPEVRSAALEPTVTGPTRLGLEFNIARQDLRVGETELSLTARDSANSNLQGSFSLTIMVEESPLKARINNGVNGTIIQTGRELVLSGENSRDPDTLSNTTEPDPDMKFNWMYCRKSLISSFDQGYEDCSTLLPGDGTQESITISFDILFNARLDKSSDPKPTFFLFGLKVSKGNREAVTFLYYQLQTTSSSQTIPTLTSLEVVNSKGIVLNRMGVSTFSDIIIRPWTDDENVSWKYEMGNDYQRYVLTQEGVVKGGNEFLQDWDATSRLPLRFKAGSLKPNQDYTVVAKTFAKESSATVDHQITFMTLEAPKLTCEAPIIKQGTVSETMFTVAARMNFEREQVEYCFSVVTSPVQKIPVGKGCSSVPFAKFSFDIEGSFDIECMAKSVDGIMIDRMTISSAITVVPVQPDSNTTPAQILSNRLDKLTSRVEECSRVRDDSCLLSLMSVVDDVTGDVEDVVLNGDSESTEMIALKEKAQTYVSTLAEIAQQLASKGVVKATHADAITQVSFAFCNVPKNFFDYNSLVSSLSLLGDLYTFLVSSDSPVLSETNAKKTVACVNQTITTANSIATAGSSRRRLLQESCESTLNCLVPQVSRFLVLVHQQSLGCGESSTSEGNYPQLETRKQHRNDSSSPAIVVGSSTVCQLTDRIETRLDEAHTFTLKRKDATFGFVTLSGILIPEEYLQCLGLAPESPFGFQVISTKDDESSDREYIIKMAVREDGLTENKDGLYKLNLRAKDNENDPNLFGGQCPVPAKASPRSVTISDQTITFTVPESGLYLAARAAGFQAGDLTGLSGGLLIGLLVTMGIIILIASVIAIWFVATNCVVLPDLPVVTNWEYVERDMFGRGHITDGTPAFIASPKASEEVVFDQDEDITIPK